MKLSANQFRDLFAKSGYKTNSKGRPIIDIDGIYGEPNKKVKNAKKVISPGGEVLADSKWEYHCKNELERHRIAFEFQKAFNLLPTVKTKPNTLKKRKWTPDFVFAEHKIVADAKGHITEMARIKIHLFHIVYPDWEVVILKTKKDLSEFIDRMKQNKFSEICNT